MFFAQVLHRDLGCASYVLGDAGEAVVVDPRWDIGEYLGIAAAQRLAIVHVIDTHDHADHVSGRARLAAATGACSHRPLAPADARAAAGEPLTPGTSLTVGRLRLTALGAPGHRPEHLAFAVADLSRGEDPWLVLTGDSLLVGDVARPDLAYEALEGAGRLHATLRELLALGDHVEVWPGHVGGSLCGGAGLSDKTSSTIGYERRHNPLLEAPASAFVAGVTASLPCRPPNVERIVALNRAVQPALPADPAAVTFDELPARLAAGATIVDGRAPEAFDAGHLPGAINLPLSSPGVGTRAGWALDPGDRLLVVAADPAAGRRMAGVLQAVGFWQIDGTVVADPDGWAAAGLPVATAAAWDVDRLAGGLRGDAVELVDVREAAEWDCGHVPGSRHLPLAELPAIGAVAFARNGHVTAVACAAGVRAAFAASLLRRAGHADVVRVAGGGIGDLPARWVGLVATG